MAMANVSDNCQLFISGNARSRFRTSDIGTWTECVWPGVWICGFVDFSIFRLGQTASP